MDDQHYTNVELADAQEQIANLQVENAQLKVDLALTRQLLADLEADFQYEATGGDENLTIDGVTFDNINDLI